MFCQTGHTYDLFDRDCVTEHNKLRRLHGAQPLSWSESLAEDAQKWAEYLAINDKIEHDGDTLTEMDEGENIAWFVPPQPKCQGAWKPNCVTCGEVVQNWYDEAANYNFQTGTAKKPDLPVKHFAQVRSGFIFIDCFNQEGVIAIIVIILETLAEICWLVNIVLFMILSAKKLLKGQVFL